MCPSPPPRPRRFAFASTDAPWHAGAVTEQPVEPAAWLTVPDTAQRLDIPVTRVHQMLRDHHLLAVRRDGVLQIPAELVAGRTVLKHLPGVLTLLRDAGYNDEESLRWLYTEDDSLPGTPAVALDGGRRSEERR